MTDAELKRDMSCREIEAQTGVSKATISRFLNNGHDISLSTARKLLPVLKDCPCCNRADLSPAAVTVKPLEWDGRKTTDVMFQYRVHIGYGLMNGVFALTLSGSTIGEFHSEETAKAAAQADYDRRILSALTPGTQPATEQPDDVAVNRFAEAMKAKMAAAREKGRSGWDDPEQCSLEFLASLLIGHVRKGNAGNFEDIANLCMMLHQRGADPSILPATEQPSVKEAAVDALASYQQADADGIMVLVSRQAIEECLPALRSLAQGDE